MNMVELPLEQITVPADHVRSNLDQVKLEDLKNSIAEVGLLQPIIVIEDGEHYRLVAGARRLASCIRLGYETIPALVLSEDASVRQVQIIENIQREDLNPVDRAVAVQLFIQENKLSVLKASQKLGVPRTTINDWLAVLDLDEKYQNAVINNYYGGSSPLTLSHVSLAKRFANKVGSENMLNVVLDAILHYGLNRAETRRVLKLVESAKDLSIDQAVRMVRLIPRKRDSNEEPPSWSVEKLVDSLSKSGDYLVKTKPDDLRQLDDEQRKELARRARALQRLLDEVLEAVEEDTHIKRSILI